MKRKHHELSQANENKVVSLTKDVRSKKVQGLLNFRSDLNVHETKTCPVCGMTYYKLVKKDQQVHDTYHKTFLSGPSWIKTKQTVESLIQYSLKSDTLKKRVDVKIIIINKDLAQQIRRVEEILGMVNQELNASPGSNLWLKKGGDSIESKAFLALIDNRVVGLVTTETIKDLTKQSRWMILKTQTIVPHQINKAAKLGISRIWVAPTWRRYGIATKLLEMVLRNSVHGIILDKRDIAFSQPSTSGGLLCKKFNGLTHKSGEILLPVYLD